MRTLTTDDAALVGKLVADAFVEDPPVMWVVPNESERAVTMRPLFTAVSRMGLEANRVLATDDLLGSVCYAPPEVARPVSDEAKAEAASAVAALGEERSALVRRFLTTLDEQKAELMAPTTWELKTLAVSPLARGRGYGVALMDAVSDDADKSEAALFLQTFRPWNVGFYERRGYRVVDERVVPDSPLTLWGMQRH